MRCLLAQFAAARFRASASWQQRGAQALQIGHQAQVTPVAKAWLDVAQGLSLKTAERYRQLSEQQIIPHLGDVILQKLRPSNVAAWHATLLTAGGKVGRPLSARTAGHAHRVLHQALRSRKRSLGSQCGKCDRAPQSR